MCCAAFCVTASLCFLCLRLLQAPGVHPPAVADGVEEAAAAGGAGVAARHLRRAVLHQAAAAARRVHRVGLVTLVNSSNISFNKQVWMIVSIRFPVWLTDFFSCLLAVCIRTQDRKIRRVLPLYLCLRWIVSSCVWHVPHRFFFFKKRTKSTL